MFIVEIDVFAEGQGRRHVNNDVTDEIAIAVDWSAAEGWNLPSPTPPVMGSMSKTPRRTARGQQSKWPRGQGLHRRCTIIRRSRQEAAMPHRRVKPDAPRDRWGHVRGDPHHNFLRTAQWQRIRRAFLAHHPLCEHCTLLGRTTAATRPIISCASSTTITLGARRGKACRRFAPAPHAQEQMGARLSPPAAVPRHAIPTATLSSSSAASSRRPSASHS